MIFLVLEVVRLLARAQVEGLAIAQANINIALTLGKSAGTGSIFLLISVAVELAVRFSGIG